MNGLNDGSSSRAFGIEDTMEIMGNQELLNDLLSPETSTGDPNDIQPIIKEVDGKQKKEEPEKPVKQEPDVQKNIISSILGEEEDEEDEGSADVGKEKKKVKETDEKSKEVDENESGFDFSLLSKDLFKLGVFSPDEDEEDEPVIDTPEKLLERFNVEKKKGAIEIVDNFIGQFGEDYQQAFDSIFVKGVNPRDYFTAYNNIVNFSEMDMAVESNQEAVIRRVLSDQGLETEDVEAEVQRLKSYGDLEAVSTRHHKVLVKKEAMRLKELEENSQKELQQKAIIKNQYIQNVQTILQEKLKAKEFDGIPINPKTASELQDFLLVDKYKTASGETLTDFDRTILELKKPENHAMKVKIALLVKLLEKDPNLSTIQRSGVTKESNQLFGQVARQVSKAKQESSQQANNKGSTWFK